jgi:hypothetical protein
MSKKFFSINIFLSKLLILNIIINNCLCEKKSISLPFTVYKPTADKDSTKEKFFEINNKINFYTDFDIGNPIKKITIFYNFENSILSLHSNLKMESVQSTFEPKDSKTFKKLDNNKVEDELSIQVKNEQKINKFIFSYENLTEADKNIIGCIGLQNFYQEVTNNKVESSNFLTQLKNLGLIDYISFNINYTSDYQGFVNINIEPDELSPNLYSNKNKHSASVKDIKSNYPGNYLWNLEINSIYHINDEKKEVLINSHSSQDKYSALLNPTYGLIKGSESYKNIIEKDFFKKLIDSNICSISNINNKLFHSCNAINKNEIKEKFPTLYFHHQKFNYKFELNFNDLFYIKNDIMYFLIYFVQSSNNDEKYAQISEWILGKPFLKKYQFSFDVENNKIFFYENIKEFSDKNINLKMNNALYVEQLMPSKKLVIISLSLFIIFVFLFCASFYIQKSLRKDNIKSSSKDKKYTELEESPDSFNQKDIKEVTT